MSMVWGCDLHALLLETLVFERLGTQDMFRNRCDRADGRDLWLENRKTVAADFDVELAVACFTAPASQIYRSAVKHRASMFAFDHKYKSTM